MSSLNIQVLTNTISEPKLKDTKENFLKYTFSKKDLKSIFELGIEVYNETECIDERANAQTVFAGKIRIENNVPGGGFDYYTSQDMQILLKSSRGNVILDPHRSCGWGGIRMNYYLNYKKSISKRLPGTTMVVPTGVEFDKGLDYVEHLVARAFTKNNFLNSVMRSTSLKTQYQYQKDFKQALEVAFANQDEIAFTDDLHKDLISIAFVYGKMLELKEVMEDEAEIMGLPIYNIRLNPDMLFDMPDDHIAKDAIFNLTDRKFYSRIPRDDKYATFYNDITTDTLKPVLLLVAQIMAGNHSKTADLEHDFFIFAAPKDTKIIKDLLNELKLELQKLKTKKAIYLYELDPNQKPKDKNDLLDLVR